MTEHRYSGWPGAYCLNCGAPDPFEEALAHGCDDVHCIHCGISYPQDEPCTPERNALIFVPDVGDNHVKVIPDADSLSFFYPHEIETKTCGEHGSEECPPHGHFAQEDDKGVCLLCLENITEEDR